MNEQTQNASKMDWQQIHRRLQENAERTAHGWLPDQETTERILAERTRTLAREPEPGEMGEAVPAVEFLLAHERFAVEIGFVREVFLLQDLTQLPCAPPFIRGIINVRGRLLSVTDLKVFFGLPERGLGDLNKVIVLSSDVMETGIIADQIIGVRTVPLDNLQQRIATFSGIHEHYLKGVTPDRTALLDASRILADPAIVVEEEA